MKRYNYTIVCIITVLNIATSCNVDTVTKLSSTEKNTIMQSESMNFASTNDLKPSTVKTYNDLKGVIMTVKDGTITDNKLTLTFANNTKKHCIYGEFFSLEKKVKECWYRVPVVVKGDYAFNTIGYELPSNGKSEMVVDWNWLYGSLNTGEYRIIKNVSDFRGTGDYDDYILAAEFSVP